ncbi:MAG: ATP-binding protein [Dehalococcoidia bacterium]|nr:ATP-binding protein [Dehalococcoidia bacterium]
MSRSIFWKITIPSALLILLSMGALGSYVVTYVKNAQIDQLRSHMVKEARLVAEASRPAFFDPSKSDSLDVIAKTTGKLINAGVTLVTVDGKALGDSAQDPSTLDNQSAHPEVIEALASGVGASSRYSAAFGETTMYVAVPVIGNGRTLGVAVVAMPLTVEESSVRGAVTTIAVVTMLAALLTVLGAALIARMITRPVRQITRAAQRISSGQLDQQIGVQTDDEIGLLGRAFNEMSVSLKSTIATINDDRSRLAAILSGISDGMILSDLEGAVVMANPAAQNLFGFSEEKARGRPLIEVVRDHEIDEVLKKCLATSREQTAQLYTSTNRFIRAIAVPLSGSKPGGAILLLQDLTEMRSLQTMRREFVGNISHELRTPLATIKAMVETLQDGAIDDKPVARDFLAKIDAEVDRMTQVVEELSELSRIETGRVKLDLEPLDLNQLVEEARTHLAPLAERQKVTLTIEPSPDLPAVPADRQRLRQVITNIVHNAIKFTPAGGKVLVSTMRRGDTAVVLVSDTGIGISREDLPRIFERFFKADRSRSTGGSGLGLAIAKHTVQIHGGDIWVKSEEGKGSTFGFSLPLKPKGK